MAIAGRVAIVPKGDWSADATYKRLDAVTYNNTLYFAKKEVPAGTETSNTEYWSKSIVGSVVTVDDVLSPTSTNPVQNKVVTSNLTDLRKGAVVNLLKPTLQTRTQNGVTCTNNGDGTYTLNGTATKAVVLYITGSPNKNAVGGYKLLGCPINGSNDTYRIVVSYYDNESWQAEGTDLGNGVIIDGTYSRINYLIKVESGTTVTNLVFKPMITTDLNATYDDFVSYTGDTGRLNGDVAELKAQSVKKDDIVNNQTTTVEGFALDARQANPNVEGSLGAQIKAINDMLNAKKVPSFGIENIFTGNPLAVISGSGDLASFEGTKWEQDNGGYHVSGIKYPAGGTVSLTVSMTLPANSIVIVDVNTLNYENIKVQGTLIKYNLTNSPSYGNVSIIFSGRTENATSSTIRYMPLVIHLG